MDLPSIPRSEVRTRRGLQTIAACLRKELSPREVDYDAVAQTITGPGDDKELFGRFSALFMDAVRPPDYFGLDEWLRRQLDFDPSEVDAETRPLLAEVLISWIVIVGALGEHRRAIELSETIVDLRSSEEIRARAKLALCDALAHNLPASELGPKRAVAIALATAAEARELGTDPTVVSAFEGRLHAEAGRVGDLPVRARIRHLRAAVSRASQLTASVPLPVQEEIATWRTRAEQTLAKLEALGWFHRLVGFAPDA